MTLPTLTIKPHRDTSAARGVPGRRLTQMVRDDHDRYLTDGVHLYRAVGTLGETAATGLIGLEDCRSLDVVLVAPEELDGLRTVEPVTS